MYKKGGISLSLWWLINLFLTVLVLMPLLIEIMDISKDSKLERSFIAKDVATTISSIYASPNDLIYFYTENNFPYTITFNESTVMVSDDLKTSKNYFVEDKNIKLIYKTIEPVIIDDEDESNKYIPLGFKKKDAIDPFSAIKTSEVLQ